MDKLLKEIRKCTLCREFLPLEPKPILNFTTNAKILLVGQAPGIKAHESGKPWNDASGVRLREWLGISDEIFYDPKIMAIVPMAFCYPGRGKSGDLPPRPECSRRWMEPIVQHLTNIELKLIVGGYARNYFMKSSESLTDAVRHQDFKKSGMVLLPHPSPRNNIWLKKNPWFEEEIVPQLKKTVDAMLKK